MIKTAKPYFFIGYIIMNLYNADCNEWFTSKAKKNTVDLVVVDLPYGQILCDWDKPIDLKAMWRGLKPHCAPHCWYVFFTTTRYGVDLINSRPAWFRYDIVWRKSKSVGYLQANKQQLRAHEMIYIFAKPVDNADLDLTRNIKLREYSKTVEKYISKPMKQINKEMGNQGFDHFFRHGSSQFGLPTSKNYKKACDIYKLNKMPGYITHTPS